MPPTEETYNDHRPGLAPPRFGLRALFALIALLSVCLATFVSCGPVLGSALLLGLMAVVAHVAGNAIGSRLRANGSQPAATVGAKSQQSPWHDRRPSAGDFAPRTRLSHRAPLGWFMRIMTFVGMIAGAVAGGIFLTRTSATDLSHSTVAFGCLATGVLGGMFAFWLFSLLQVFLMAWWQAHWHGHNERR